jgi:hypothetical protein
VRSPIPVHSYAPSSAPRFACSQLPICTHVTTERKVGCDRTLPKCANCIRSVRVCQGYGLKLAWPDKVDGRRKQKNYQAALSGGSTKDYVTRDGNFAFLNTTTKDLSGVRVGMRDVVEEEMLMGSGSGLILLPPPSPMCGVDDQDGMLLTYYDSVLARMITTIDDNTNGFRLDLIRMALSSSDASSRSLLQATLALSSFHLGRPEEALKHKVLAIKSLNESLQGDAQRMTQIAACMMLCVYSVGVSFH